YAWACSPPVIVLRRIIPYHDYLPRKPFSKYREQPFKICTDTDALPVYHRNTFLSISGPLSNEFSDVALRDVNNRFLRFIIKQGERGNYGVIESISDGRTFDLSSEDVGTDLGIVVKLRNSQAVERHVFVCAGIEKYGTSGAVWYLTNRWRQLYKEFGTGEFGLVVKVVRAQESLTTRVYTVK
ncbi:MAG: hypothetical protein PHY79_23030, partial [Anaerolineae bacterium]|nr:hypothetical protein [Anaerolineae bacterium]